MSETENEKNTKTADSSDEHGAENLLDNQRHWESNEIEKGQFRSPWLLARDKSALLVIDVQEKLLPHISNYHRVLWNIRRLVDGAQNFQLPVFCTEQYPQGLGSTVAEIAKHVHADAEKLIFSCRNCSPVVSKLTTAGVHRF